MKKSDKYLAEISERISIDKSKFDLICKQRENLADFLFQTQKTDSTFPLLFETRNTIFGTFARKTDLNPPKIVRLLLCLTGNAHFKKNENDYQLIINKADKRLYNCSIDEKLSPKLLLDSLVKSIAKTEKFEKVTQSKNGKSINIWIKNFDFPFNITPGFFIGENIYLIPKQNENFQQFKPSAFQLKLRTLKLKSEELIYDVIKLTKQMFKNLQLPDKHFFLIETLMINHLLSNEHFDASLSKNMIEIIGAFTNKLNQPVFDSFVENKNINTLNEIECKNLIEKLSIKKQMLSNKNDEELLIIWKQIFEA